jgi:c-di-GMP-binding flagellar brake protein YcgR
MGSDGDKTELEEGEVCIVRGFTGQYEYSFLSKVLQTFEKPFAYALLAYPARVDAKLVRQSMRTKTSWPTSAAVVEANGAIGELQEVTLVDISASGAMIKASSALTPIGGTLALEMKVSVEDAPFTLKVQAAVCHSNRAKYEEAYFMGLAFKELTQQDKLVLHYLTQSSMS